MPIVLLNVESCSAIRDLLINKYFIEEITYGDFAVFAEANIDTMVLRVINQERLKNYQTDVQKYSAGYSNILDSHQLDYDDILNIPGYKISLKKDYISKRISSQKLNIIKISEIVDFYNGIATGPDKEKYFTYSKTSENQKPLLMGNNIAFYKVNYDGRYIIYDREKLHRPREEKIFLAKEKIVMQRIRNLKLERRLVCSLDTSQFYTFNSVNNLLLKEGSKYNLRYVLAILNSKLLNYLLKQYSLNTNITLSDLELLPIRALNFDIRSDKEIHDEIVKGVKIILRLNEQIDKIQLQTQLDQIKTKINYLEDKINHLIYILYGLSDQEITTINRN